MLGTETVHHEATRERIAALADEIAGPNKYDCAMFELETAAGRGAIEVLLRRPHEEPRVMVNVTGDPGFIEHARREFPGHPEDAAVDTFAVFGFAVADADGITGVVRDAFDALDAELDDVTHVKRKHVGSHDPAVWVADALGAVRSRLGGVFG